MATIEKRSSKSGQTVYRVKVRLKGHPAQTATFNRLTDARKWAQQTESAIQEGRYFKTTEARKHTLNKAIDRYIKNVLPLKPRNIKNQTLQLNWWKEAIGTYLLADVTPSLIVEQREKLAKGITKQGRKRSPATVNRYLAALSHVFTLAVKEWGWVEDNPFRKVTKFKESRGRVRFLSDEERERLLNVCRDSKSSTLYLAVVLSLSTGARKMELLSLHWSDVDLNRKVIVLHETKNGDRRLLPLSGLAFELVKEHSKVRRIDTDFIFPNQKGDKPLDIRSAWERALEKAEIEDFRFHDLRHSAASYLAMNGATMAEIAEVLGHKTLQMVKRYAHLSDAHTAGVVARMNERIFNVK